MAAPHRRLRSIDRSGPLPGLFVDHLLMTALLAVAVGSLAPPFADELQQVFAQLCEVLRLV